MRTVSVSLYGAWINDESKKPIAILNSVPSYVYNLEVSTAKEIVMRFYNFCFRYGGLFSRLALML